MLSALLSSGSETPIQTTLTDGFLPAEGHILTVRILFLPTEAENRS